MTKSKGEIKPEEVPKKEPKVGIQNNNPENILSEQTPKQHQTVNLQENLDTEKQETKPKSEQNQKIEEEPKPQVRIIPLNLYFKICSHTILIIIIKI